MFFKSNGNEIYSDIPIPSLFFDLYFTIADGNQIKVYLLGYKSAFLYRGFKNDGVDNKVIASMLNITENEVLEIWKYWESMGIVKLHNKDDKFNIEFLDVKTEYFNRHSKSKTSSELIDETISNASSIEYINMYNKIENMAGRVLTPSEKIDILNAIKEYDMETELAIEAFKKAISDNGRIKSVKYVIGIMKSWFDNSVKNIDDLDYLCKDRKNKNDNYKVVFNALSFHRSPTSFEKEIIDRWVYEYNMPMEVILKACEKSININNPNIRYFDAIIKSWHEKKIRTVEDAEKEDRNFSKKRFMKGSSQKSKPDTKPSYKTKFHNFEPSNSEKYSEESLAQLINNPKSFKKK